MRLLALVFAEFVGMFIDDEFLAVALLAVVGFAAVLAFFVHAPAFLVGVALLAGCLIVLVASAVKGIRRG
ncbi:hypothetical protein JP75_19475 [Devosia riboflavina]|uniref:Uncharacterized protein n=1 Tax=Devosia riboflavina TaxID=46914 RepID=A0A087LYS1_9HYPH|nr:hypothetical protein JP75_19475 [Devosia riboflavina]